MHPKIKLIADDPKEQHIADQLSILFNDPNCYRVYRLDERARQWKGKHRLRGC